MFHSDSNSDEAWAGSTREAAFTVDGSGAVEGLSRMDRAAMASATMKLARGLFKV